MTYRQKRQLLLWSVGFGLVIFTAIHVAFWMAALGDAASHVTAAGWIGALATAAAVEVAVVVSTIVATLQQLQKWDEEPDQTKGT